ncbi:hypothetical protein [Zhongshania arctica]|uniref:Uncharacterized protein n=1 Tax=Zhongshania arctica TaxID=3238302 RepID=A0ABV3U0X0_9GAMM
MKPLNVILLSAALSAAGHAHSQNQLTGLLAVLPLDGLGSLSLPAGGAGLGGLTSILSLDGLGGLSLPAGGSGLTTIIPLDGLGGLPSLSGGSGLTSLTSVVGEVLPQVLDLVDQTVLPLVNGLLGGNQLLGGLTPVTSDLLGSVVSSGLPVVIQVVGQAVPVLDGVTASGSASSLPTGDLLGGILPVVLDLTNSTIIPLLGGVVPAGII